MIVAIHPAHIDLAWLDIGPMLARAVRHTPDKPDVLARLKDRTAQLWVVLEAARPIAAVVTEITTVSRERWCRLWLVAGERVAEWVHAFLDRVEPWARAEGCIGLWASGREGWARLAARLDWRREGSDAGFPRWTWRF